MLKKVLASVLSISVIGSTLVVPAFADYKTEEITTSLVNETFEGELIVPTEMQDKAEYKLGEYVYLKSTQPQYSTRSIENGKFKTTITKKDNDENTNPYTAISFRPATEQTLTEGDKIHINFDFTGENGSDTLNLGMFLNGNFDTAEYKRFVGINETYDKNTKDTNSWAGSKMLSWLCGKDNKIRLGTSLVEKAKDADLTKGMNIDVVLNPYDSTQGNEQTVKLTYKYKTSTDESKEVVFYAKYDADYKGDSTDTTYDKITSFKGLTLETNQQMAGTYTVDNVVIEKLRDDKTYYTSTVKNLIDEDFSGLTFAENHTRYTIDRLTTVDKDRKVYFNENASKDKATSSVNKGEIVFDSEKNKNVFKQGITSSNWGEHTSKVIILNPEGSTELDNGDIVKFSFDLKVNMTPKEGATPGDHEANYFVAGPQLNLTNGNGYAYFDNTMSNINQYADKISDYATGTDTDTGSVTTENKNRARDALLSTTNWLGQVKFAGRDYSDKEGLNKFTANKGEWNHYEYIINTADPAKNGNQTMAVYVNGEKVMYGILDKDAKTEGNQKFTKVTALGMTLNGEYNGNLASFDVLSTNYKLDIIKPGIGLSGNAIKDHDPEAAGGIKLEEGDLKIDVNLNVPGTVKKSSEEAGTGTVASIYVAQYDESGLLKEINVLTTDSGEFTQSNSSISRTIQVKSGVEQVKIFGFDGALRPIFTNVVGGVVKVDPQNISFNTENGVDSSQH